MRPICACRAGCGDRHCFHEIHDAPPLRLADRKLDERETARVEVRNRFEVHLVGSDLHHFVFVGHRVAARPYLVAGLLVRSRTAAFSAATRDVAGFGRRQRAPKCAPAPARNPAARGLSPDSWMCRRWRRFRRERVGVPDAIPSARAASKESEYRISAWRLPAFLARFHWADFADCMVNGWLKPAFTARFAINLPFTMRMLDLSASGTKSAISFKTLLVITAANVSGAD